ncbi:MAG TPA: glycosyl transferase [Xanthobacteraceae bacterium]|jgi:UDP-N-acetylmuramyl pentapeptide phosphotransferase/UDP-N-acetylglucosamine-1-phosphate transferase
MSDGNFWILAAAVTIIVAAMTSTALIVGLSSWLKRYALANPNARSSHRTPTPQGGGIAVIAATIVAVGVALLLWPQTLTFDASLLPIAAATVTIAAVGAIDDLRPLRIAPRLLLQALAVAAVICAVPADLRVLTIVPWWAERFLLLIGGLWFINLVNFMDGIDLMTVAEVIPLTATLGAMGIMQALPANATAVALALGGATAGFAYFNRPVARLFLGDVGSLPIGLLLGWLLLLLAGGGHLIAAVLMPLYYLADTTVTLLRRLLRHEPVWQAHRTHFYQRATDRGFTVAAVVSRVFLVNVGLCALALLTVVAPGAASGILAVLGGATLVAGMLCAFARGKK